MLHTARRLTALRNPVAPSRSPRPWRRSDAAAAPQPGPQMTSPSPFSTHLPGRLVVKGTPTPSGPRDAAERAALEASLPGKAADILAGITLQQSGLWGRFPNARALRGQHVLLVGGTAGLGAATAVALKNILGPTGSLTIVALDRTKVGLGEDLVLPLYVGKALLEQGSQAEHTPVALSNDGAALEGPSYDAMMKCLSSVNASNVLYINMAAAASSGLIRLPDGTLPPPVFVRSVLTPKRAAYVQEKDRAGFSVDGGQSHLMYWDLPELTPKQVESTRNVMGHWAVGLPEKLRQAGVGVAQENYAGWRGSYDVLSRDPASDTYGAQGAYSTSLWLPKDVIRDYMKRNDLPVPAMYHFFPTMRTRALGLIPGGPEIAAIYAHLLAKTGRAYIGVPELALMMLDTMGQALTKGFAPHPTPRYDMHEQMVDFEAGQIVANLSDDPASPFFYGQYGIE